MAPTFTVSLIALAALSAVDAAVWTGCKIVTAAQCPIDEASIDRICFECNENSAGIQCVSCDDFPDTFDSGWDGLWSDYSFTALFWLCFVFAIVACICAGALCFSVCIRICGGRYHKYTDETGKVRRQKKNRKAGLCIYITWVVVFLFLVALGVVAIVACAIAPRDVEDVPVAFEKGVNTYTSDFDAFKASVATPIAQLPSPYNPSANNAVNNGLAAADDSVKTINKRMRKTIRDLEDAGDRAKELFYTIAGLVGLALIFAIIAVCTMLPCACMPVVMGIILALTCIALFIMIGLAGTAWYFADDGCAPIIRVDDNNGYDSSNQLNIFNNLCASIINGSDEARGLTNGSDYSDPYCTGVRGSLCNSNTVTCMDGAAAYDFTSNTSACKNGAALDSLPTTLMVTVGAVATDVYGCAAGNAPCNANSTLVAQAAAAILARQVFLGVQNTTLQQYEDGGLFTCAYVPPTFTNDIVKACNDVRPAFAWAGWQSFAFTVVLTCALLLFFIQQCLRPCRAYKSKEKPLELEITNQPVAFNTCGGPMFQIPPPVPMGPPLQPRYGDIQDHLPPSPMSPWGPQ